MSTAHDVDRTRSWTLASRLAAVTSMLIIVACVAQGGLLVHRHVARVRDYLADRARPIAARLAEDSELGVLSGDREGLSFIAEQALYRNDVAWVRVVDHEGILLASAGTPKTETLSRIRGADRLIGPILIDTRFWEFQAPVVTVANPPQREEMQLFDPADAQSRDVGRRERRRIGTVAVGISLAPLHRLQREALTTAMGLTSLVMLLAVASATWFARAITRPLKKLAGATNAIARGDLGVRVDSGSGDEIGALAQSFNVMADSIADKQAALESYSRTLEEKVRARTQHLEDVNRELEEASRLKSEFLATVSHELRTPLNVILGYTEMLAEDSAGALTDAQRELVATIDRYSRLQLSLITNVLDFSRLSSGKVSVHVERFVLASLLEEVATLTRAHMKNDVHLDVRVDTLTIELETDRVKLQEILRNLLDNAMKFTERGSITVVGHRDVGNDRVIIEIRDTGCGIPPNELPRIFDPFLQVGDSRTRSTGGVGLGLSIVKSLVSVLGGEITVRSTIGEGSVFEVSIPRRLAAEELQSVA